MDDPANHARLPDCSTMHLKISRKSWNCDRIFHWLHLSHHGAQKGWANGAQLTLKSCASASNFHFFVVESCWKSAAGSITIGGDWNIWWFENGDLPIEHGVFIYTGWCFGTMEFYDFPIILGMSFHPNWRFVIVFRGVGWNHQPAMFWSPHPHVFWITIGSPGWSEARIKPKAWTLDWEVVGTLGVNG